MGVSGAAEKVEKVRDGERLGLRWVAVKLVLRKSSTEFHAGDEDVVKIK